MRTRHQVTAVLCAMLIRLRRIESSSSTSEVQTLTSVAAIMGCCVPELLALPLCQADMTRSAMITRRTKHGTTVLHVLQMQMQMHSPRAKAQCCSTQAARWEGRHSRGTGSEVIAMQQARRADLQLGVGDRVSRLPTGRLEALCPSITTSAVCSPALKPSGPRCATAHQKVHGSTWRAGPTRLMQR